MVNTTTKSYTFCSLLIVVSFVTSIGCARNNGILNVDDKAAFPAGALPGPFGEKVCAWHAAQAASAALDRQVFYKADFVGNTPAIAPAALRKFAQRASDLDPAKPLSLIVEPSGDMDLDQARINALTRVAAQLNLLNTEIQVGYGAALGLLGPEAERLGRRGTLSGNSGGGTVRSTGGRGIGSTGFGGRGGNVGGIF